MYIYKEQLQRLVDESSQHSVAKRSGINQAVLSKYLHENYDGKIDELNDKISAFLSKEARKSHFWKDVRVVDTNVKKEMISAMQITHAMLRFGVVNGPAGIGKSTAIEEYREQNRATTVLIKGSPVCKSVAGVITLIYEAIFKQVMTLSPRNANSMICQKLMASEWMILVDEAQEFVNDAFEQLRSIYDTTGCAVMLIGTPELMNRLTNPRTGTILQQVRSRIPIIRTFGVEPIENDVKLICNAYSINDKQIIKRLQQRGGSGGLRTVSDCIRMARFLSNGRQLTIEDIINAEKLADDDNQE